ncbi:twin-arginine translocation pathway signal [Bradyrhizobium sp. CCBAU 11386]|uniref:twin-arginine translocation pathway signal n=1 Tax=Bradyrhizobium sp. CCBAU 11386 TaxID=1630837 RepID=UPI002303BA8B|nr:twin-arginine translocation pathway signal [Bradyrhizobium sp. CCBAU 11386]MDA9506074.1 twin-arginine translocation pathway signal [Bradyrhizobium sp. CCBAU 11386]
MPVSFLSRCRPVRALLPLSALCAALAGCAGVSDTISPAFVDPARYDLWDCKQLASERKNVAKRIEDLERLMAKAETGTGGVVVAELAYRNDYLAARGQQKLIEETWRRNRCRESDMEAAAPPAQPTAAPAPASPARPSRPKSGGAVN